MNELTLRFLEVYNYVLNSKKIENASSFAKKIAISSSLMNEILKGRTNAGINPIQNTVNSYPEINPTWLLTGKGEMLVIEVDSTSTNIINDDYLLKENEMLRRMLEDKDEIIRMQRNEIERLNRSLDSGDEIRSQIA